jgi:hypothetical protein
MRLLLASVATLAAVALAAPSFAQQETAPTPAPVAKPKQGTTAYCNSLKSASSRSSCLKRGHASTSKTSTTASASKKTKAKKVDPTKTDTSASATPASTQSALPPQTVDVPPLPQKTI